MHGLHTRLIRAFCDAAGKDGIRASCSRMVDYLVLWCESLWTTGMNIVYHDVSNSREVDFMMKAANLISNLMKPSSFYEL